MLRGVKVIQLASLLPGPLCGKMLQSLGASVTTVEPPAGDSIRNFDLLPGSKTGVAFYEALNRGKEHIRLDFHDASDQSRFKSVLAHEADVLVMSLRPGALRHAQLEPQDLRRLFPNLVICCITGYGLDPSTPLMHRAGHDINYLARSGVLAMSTKKVFTPTMETDDEHNSNNNATHPPPAPPPPPPPPEPVLRPAAVQIADIAGGTYPAVTQILAQLFYRERRRANSNNQTQHRSEQQGDDGLGIIDVAMCDCSRSLSLLNETARLSLLGKLDVENESFMLSGANPCYRFYGPTADGRLIAVGALEKHFWTAFVATIDIDKKFASQRYQFAPEDTAAHREVTTSITRRVMSKSLAEWTSVFEANENCCADPVLTGAEAAASRHFVERSSKRGKNVVGGEDCDWVNVNSPFRMV